ncbi:MAG: CRTAC1 family protein [Thermoanaerobaculia bacterium]|nr:CRTAC1 family protein [Thermoanaerobaculia bacterium]
MRPVTAGFGSLLVFATALAAAEEPSVCRLPEVGRSVGLVFDHDRGASARRHLPETMGAGVAWLDFDGDGWMDLYAVQSGVYPPTGELVSDGLFRNRGDGTFDNVAERAGARHRGYGQGALAADFDGDGATDLLILAAGPVTLLRNRGDGTFEDRTARSGLESATGWSSAAAAADADFDGDLDLYVVRYLEYDPAAELFCGDSKTGVRDYCDPSLFQGEGDRFYRNRGDGTFEDATAAAGLSGANGRGLGVMFTDLDGDGDPDLYVANDLTINFLFANRGDGTFEDLSLLSGAAVNRFGKPEASMGIVTADFDQDGDPDLAVTNFDVETNTLYANRGSLAFEDISAPSGFGVPSFTLLGFGIVAADLDFDGALDTFVANGHIFEKPKRANVAYRQRPLLLLGDGAGRFREQRCAELDANPQVARALALGDPDRDGDPDLAISNNGGPLQLRRTQATSPTLAVRLSAATGNPEAIGARITLKTTARRAVRWLTAGDSYQATSDKAQFFALPPGETVEEIEVRWPHGKTTRLRGTLAFPASTSLVIAGQ